MKTHPQKTAAILLTSILIFACTFGQNASTPDPAPAQSLQATAEPQAESPQTSLPVAGPIEACKLPAYAFTNVGFGLPNPPHKLPSLGDVKTIVLFADFSDVPASQTPQELFNLISPDAETFFNVNSYGRMNWQLEPHFEWLRLSQPSSVYGEGIRTYEGHLQFIQEAVTLADSKVDFSTADSVIVLAPPEAYSIPYGPAFGANPGQGYTADGKTFENGVTSGADLPGWGFLWLNHEAGHTLGLPDLYAYQFDSANYDDQHRFVGGFGLMGYIDGLAPEFFAFERWQLGWLDDTQIACQPTADQTITITPIETAGGIKAVMVPVSESKVLVVESRRPVGYDANLVEAGALVYTVDTAISSGNGTLVVHPVLENDPYRNQSPLGVGESITVDGVTVTVLSADANGDTVQVISVK